MSDPAAVTSSLHSLSVTENPENTENSPPKSPEIAPKSPQNICEDDEDSWGVPWSDEEAEGSEPPGGWAPPPQEIRVLFEAIARSGLLPLRNVPRLPRREPSPAHESSDTPLDEENVDPTEETQEEKPPPPTEFDFDDEPLPPNPALIDRRRAPGPPSRGQKREARLDKVLSDMKRHKKLEEQMLRTGQELFPPEKREPLSPKRPPGLFLRHRKS